MPDYTQLADEQAKLLGMQPLPVETKEKGNASTDGKSIFVNPEFMEQIENDAGEGGVRFLLSHELGHVANGMEGGHDAEMAADDVGARSLAEQGYEKEAITGVMANLNQGPTPTHPSAPTRQAKAVQTLEKNQAGDGGEREGEDVHKKNYKRFQLLP